MQSAAQWSKCSLPPSGVCVPGCCSAGAVVTQPLVSCSADWMAAVDCAGRPASVNPLLHTQKSRYYRPVLVQMKCLIVVRQNYILTNSMSKICVDPSVQTPWSATASMVLHFLPVHEHYHLCSLNTSMPPVHSQYMLLIFSPVSCGLVPNASSKQLFQLVMSAAACSN